MAPPHPVYLPLRWLLVIGLLIALAGFAIVIAAPAPPTMAPLGYGVFFVGIAFTIGSAMALYLGEPNPKN